MPHAFNILPREHDFTQIVIDGNDGTGKTTLAARLAADLGHRVVDRDVVTYAVDHGLNDWQRRSGDVHVVLDASPEICRERLLSAGRADDRYHQPETLAYYAPRYRSVAEEIGAHIVDAEGSVDITLARVRAAIGDQLPSNWRTITEEEFAALPQIALGESKDVRSVGAGRVLIRLLPTLYSHTHNRAGVVPGTAALRVRAAKVIVGWLAEAGIPHSYLDFSGDFILASEVHSAPPIETIVKGYHVGTPTHRYFEMPIARGAQYQHPVVRFDWRNPIHHPILIGERMADETMPDDMAAFWYDVPEAKDSALAAWKVMTEQLSVREITILDVCYLLTSGNAHYGEISQDSMRVVRAGEHLDKQLWRGGSDAADILRAWESFCEMIEKK